MKTIMSNGILLQSFAKGSSSSSNALVTSEETTTVPTTTAAATTTTSTTTTSTKTVTTKPSDPCPPILPQPTQTNNLLLLTNTTNLSNYTHYIFSFETPDDATIALLVFEFQTKEDSWYLDDVSNKRSDGLGGKLIRNGGFENGATNLIWKYCYPAASYLSALISPRYCRSGKYCFASRGLDDISDYLTQTFDVQNTTTYTIEFYIFIMHKPDLLNVTISFQ